MDIEIRKNNDICIVAPSGRLDAGSAPEIEKEFLSQFEAGGKNFLVDLTKLEYISSVGLRIVLMVAKKSKAAGGKAILCGMQDHVHEVFEIAGFTSILEVYENCETALESF